MITIRMNEKGLTRMISGIAGFMHDVERRQEVLDKIKKEQAERWVRNFNSQGGEYEEWEETSEAYQKRRVEKGNAPQPTLLETGGMLDLVTDQSNKGKVTNSAVNWNFSNQPGRAYPVSHQTGYVLGRSNVPARILWDLDKEDEDRGADMLEDWLEDIAVRNLG